MSNVIEFRRPQRAPAHAAQAQPARCVANEEDRRKHVFQTIFTLLIHSFDSAPEWTADAIAGLYHHGGISDAEHELIIHALYPRGAA